MEKRKRKNAAAAAGGGDDASAIIFSFAGRVANSSFCHSPSYSRWTCSWMGLVALLAYGCWEAAPCTI